MTHEPSTASFQAGDHVRVRRSLGLVGYYHHGIYINDDRVIQFGGGIADKPHATVGAVPLSKFEEGRAAKLVPHGGRTWWGAPRFDAIDTELIVRRAERLVDAHPEGLYDLFGYNCEQAANFCSTNSYESYQVRGYFAVRSLIWIAVTPFITGDRRGSRSRVASLAIAVWLLSGLVPHVLFQLRGERFMKRVGRPMLEWERNHRI